MRVRTEAKREAIVEEAAKAFIELGFERTSMAEISARIGGSKATLYGYFPSKELLFLAVARHAGERHVQSAYQELANSVDGEEEAALRRFGEGLVGFLCQPEAVAIQRMVIAEAGRTAIGKMFFDAGPKVGHETIAEFLRGAIARGRLRRADPVVATEHLLALLNAELVPRCLLGLPVNTSRVHVRKIVARAVSVFMGAYAA